MPACYGRGWEASVADIEGLKGQLRATEDPKARLELVKELGRALAAAGNAAESRRAWEAAYKFAPNDLDAVHARELAPNEGDAPGRWWLS